MLHLSLLFIVGIGIVPTFSIPVSSDVPAGERVCENACKHEHALGTSVLVLDDGEVEDHPDAPAQSIGQELVTSSKPITTASAIAELLVTTRQPAKAKNTITAARPSTLEESVTTGKSAIPGELEMTEKPVELMDKPESKDSTGVLNLNEDTVKNQLGPHTDTANFNRYLNPSIDYFKRVLHFTKYNKHPM
ncbi:hypothetical protein PGTUg99_007274 [Puccinia graminis f. sp. tritici]|uniref:Uncharacterized protein n=1 Tax=Puccinia graminis f. sp. tritici TaxID=56615 RepID=A0A5B0SFX8_PUCGR|nr:hypothetical protein PGTUg99_007274 [Puccinia graminis f. sp. tritici]